MKIWIDLTNSPHINFFKPFIKKWRKEGHEVIITARNLANTLDLISQNGWPYEEIGGHAGKSKIKKLLYFPNRIRALYKYLKTIKPDVGISHSSFYSPLVCKLLRIPSIYLNDNEHAKGNYIAFKFATLNILPEFLKAKAREYHWTDKYKIEFYPGIKEGIYLSQWDFETINSENEESKNRNRIFIRLEPWTAEYYSGSSEFIDPVIKQLSDKYEVIILPRSEEQANHFKAAHFSKVKVIPKPIALENIYKECALFIGAGGSMTRELAFLGVPTLSVYQDELLEVDKYLIKNGYMKFSSNPKYHEIKNLLKDNTTRENRYLYKSGKEAFQLINQRLYEMVSKKNNT